MNFDEYVNKKRFGEDKEWLSTALKKKKLQKK